MTIIRRLDQQERAAWVISIAALMIINILFLVSLHRTDQANRDLLATISGRCYSTSIGESATLVIVDNAIMCYKSRQPIPREVWNRYLESKGEL